MTPINVASAWVPVVLWAMLIFYLSSIPSLRTSWGIWDFIARKIAHMVEFGILSLLIARGVRKTTSSWPLPRVLMVSALVALLYAVSDEVHQSFVPGRVASFRDVLIDGCGIMLAVLIYRQREKN